LPSAALPWRSRRTASRPHGAKSRHPVLHDATSLLRHACALLALCCDMLHRSRSASQRVTLRRAPSREPPLCTPLGGAHYRASATDTRRGGVITLLQATNQPLCSPAAKTPAPRLPGSPHLSSPLWSPSARPARRTAALLTSPAAPPLGPRGVGQGSSPFAPSSAPNSRSRESGNSGLRPEPTLAFQ